MPKAFLRRYLPDPELIIQHPSLRFMQRRLADPSLWHLNRRSASGAMFWGLFCAMLPMPFQMLPATGIALLFRINLALTMFLVWLSNPLTLLPLAWLAHATGSLILGQPLLGSAELSALVDQFTGSANSTASFSDHGKPFVIGALTLGVVFGAIGYVGMRLYWRWHVVHTWRQRQAKRQKKSDSK